MYYAKVNWYDKFKDTDVIDHMLIHAADWNEAMNLISMTYERINLVYLEEINAFSDGIVMLPENIVKIVKDYNTI